jgi:hypothetical protein
LQIGKQACRVWLESARHGRDRVVQIDLDRMSGKTHWRQFMAPFAVVALDIGISGFGNPARVVQRSFGLIELPAADQQVDVTRQTSAGELKILHDIGRALEHRHGEFDRQRVGQCCQLHTQHLHAMFGISCRRPQVAEHAIRHLLETFRLRLNAVSKHAQQPGLPGETDRLVPVGKAHAVRRARIPKQPKQAL